MAVSVVLNMSKQVPEKVSGPDVLFSRTQGGTVGGPYRRLVSAPRTAAAGPPELSMVLKAASSSLRPRAKHCGRGQLASYHRNTGGDLSSGCKTNRPLARAIQN